MNSPGTVHDAGGAETPLKKAKLGEETAFALEQSAVLRQVVKDVAKEAARSIEMQLGRWADDRLQDIQQQQQRQKNHTAAGAGGDDAVLEIALLNHQVKQLTDACEAEKMRRVECNNLSWKHQNRISQLEGELEKAKREKTSMMTALGELRDALEDNVEALSLLPPAVLAPLKAIKNHAETWSAAVPGKAVIVSALDGVAEPRAALENLEPAAMLELGGSGDIDDLALLAMETDD